jgi:prepilin-type N-terminal cleavage/methylation domain-containing protein
MGNRVFKRRLSAVRSLSREAGFGMIEMMIALSVLSIGILAVFTLMQSGMVQIQRAAAVSTAAALAEGRMENFRAVKFSAIGLADSEVDAADATYKADAAHQTDTPATTLQSSIADTATALTVTSTAGFPTAAPFRIKIGSEIMVVVAVSGATWTVSRGQDTTTPAAHSAGAAVAMKRRTHLPVCGTAPCTTWQPTSTVTGADDRTYRVDTYITWQLVQNSAGTTGRNAKRVTIVVRNPTTKVVFARATSTFDEATGL